MIIKVDFREAELIQIIMKQSVSYENIKIETMNLPLGDIIICDASGNEKLLIERKTLNDLAASIRDGRYTEQSFRLSDSNIHNHNIYYLLEGNIHTYKSSKYGQPIEKETLISSITTMTYVKGFSVYRSIDIDESALWILQTTSKLSKINDVGYYDGASKCADYVDVSKRVKKVNITQENIGAILLSQIPSVSSTSALAIMKDYDTIMDLLTAMKENKNALNNICITTKNGKPRKISKTCINNMYMYLMREIQ